MSSIIPPDTSTRTEFAHVNVHATTDANPVPTRMQEDLKQFFADAGGEHHTLERLLELTAGYLSSAYVGFFQVTGNRVAAVAVHGDKPTGKLFAMEDFVRVCSESVNEQQLHAKLINANHKLHTVAVPSIGNEPVPTVLAAVVTPDKHGLAMHAAILERMSAALMLWRMDSAMLALDWEAATSAAIAELVSGIQTTGSLRESSFMLVNALKDFVGCEQIALSFVKKVGIGCDLQSISEMAEFDKNSETSEYFTSAMDECLIREALTVWPPLDSEDRHATICHRKLAEQTNHGAAASIPLVSVDEETIGVLTLIGQESVIQGDRIQSVLRAAAPHLGTALALRQRAEPGRLVRLKNWMLGDEDNSRRKWLITAAICCVIGVPCIPWRYKVKSDCIVEPVVRRFSVAPYDGKLKASLVRPGDIVTEGQLLANMDEGELELELIDTMAERSRESTKRDVAMDVHNTSEAKLAKLEMDRLDSKAKLLNNRKSQLEITSPIAGMILKGDLDDTVGAPVEVGQTLFEIAPLNPIKLEIAIPEVELPSVEIGMEIRARLDGYHGDGIRGEIMKIHPRAEIRDSKNVFVAEVEFENPGNALRPGMSGVARVKSKVRPLGWIWFHKAWHRVRMFVGV